MFRLGSVLTFCSVSMVLSGSVARGEVRCADLLMQKVQAVQIDRREPLSEADVRRVIRRLVSEEGRNFFLGSPHADRVESEFLRSAAYREFLVQLEKQGILKARSRLSFAGSFIVRTGRILMFVLPNAAAAFVAVLDPMGLSVLLTPILVQSAAFVDAMVLLTLHPVRFLPVTAELKNAIEAADFEKALERSHEQIDASVFGRGVVRFDQAFSAARRAVTIATLSVLAVSLPSLPSAAADLAKRIDDLRVLAAMTQVDPSNTPYDARTVIEEVFEMRKASLENPTPEALASLHLLIETQEAEGLFR